LKKGGFTFDVQIRMPVVLGKPVEILLFDHDALSKDDLAAVLLVF
jgi:hypothetical protein